MGDGGGGLLVLGVTKHALPRTKTLLSLTLNLLYSAKPPNSRRERRNYNAGSSYMMVMG